MSPPEEHHGLKSKWPEALDLAGSNSPCRLEGEIGDLVVLGEIPPAIDGTFYRVMCDPFVPPDPNNVPIDGDGHVSAFRVHDGKVDMKIKYIETERYKLERKAGKALFGLYRNPYTHHPCVRAAVDSTANTNMVFWSNRLLALKEVACPYEMDPDTLETICYDPFGDQIKAKAFTAHPKVDPYSKELVVFGYEAKGLGTKDIVIYALDEQGIKHDEQWIESPWCAFIHDFVITPNWIVLLLWPFEAKVERMKAGKQHWAWSYDLPATFVVVPRRKTSKVPSSWKQGEHRVYHWKNCMPIHTGGAWEEDDGKLYLESSRVHDNAFPFFPPEDGRQPSPDAKADYVRWEIDLNAPTGTQMVDPQIIVDVPSEFPRMDERFMTHKHEFIFLNVFIPETSQGGTNIFHGLNGLAMHSHYTGETRWFFAGKDSLVQEPIFIPRTAGAPEGDGWIIAMVERRAANRSELVVLDTKEFEKPVAIIQLPMHVKAQIHGNWVNAKSRKSAEPIPRQRKGLSKARTGCMTCRCDGYGDTDSVTQQTLITQERPAITRALNNDLGVELSFHAFDHYRSHVSHQVGDTVDSDFWGDLVLRLAPTDPAIRHAISAISLMYAEKTKDTRDMCPNYRPAIVEYNKSILAVRSWPLATESRVKPLLVCLLFVCIEFMLGHEHQNAAKMHILQGRRLLANIKDRKTPEIDIIRQYLAPIYLRLAYVGNDRVDFPRHLLQMTTTPLKFASLADARCVLYYLLDLGFTLIYEVKSYRSKGTDEETLDTEEDTLQSRHKHIMRELANWRHTFEAYLAFSDLDGPDTRTAKLLIQRHSLMIVFLDSMVSGSDYVCDRNSLCEFSIATDCASFVVNHDNDVMRGPSFTFESEVVGPVYWIAAKCRQPVIRRRALEILYEREKTNRVESLTMIKHTIAMATRVIEIEEEGLEIPRGTRHIQDYPKRYEVISREQSREWAEGFLTDQKEQWPVLWDLGSHCSDIPTKLTGITAAREQKELAEGLAKGWPRERLVWPYGVTRERRVLSVVVKRHTADDLWLDYVREPLTTGGDYRVMKEHIRFT
ncbi:Apocarotenoid-15 15 oxygenase [Fusarium phyllophilum]|uniref:Apocarotenoid-15 15 oxygenase n=1 Tax=Fusarium phyllophilum TaxID=47803 RepID=A0A8H5K2T0_9HYPO|nr:Apocarotenoid-15 15 oxygenase [Fusarium phyllophilum]